MKNSLMLETSLRIGMQLEAKNAAHHRLITLLMKDHLRYRQYMTMYTVGMEVMRREKRLEGLIHNLKRLQSLK